MAWPAQCVVVIPCLNEAAAIALLVAEIQKRLPTVIVVDDGSADATATLATQAGALVIQHAQTLGKGAALKSGCRRAGELGFHWVLALDGDGQHAPTDIPALLSAAENRPAAMLVGNRMADPAGMPWLRRWVNRWMSRRLSRLTGRTLPDTQCGFRLFRLDAWSALALHTTHFEVESEMLVAFIAAGHAIEFVPVQTIYKREQSKIHPLRDTLRWFGWWRQIRPVRSRAPQLSKPNIRNQNHRGRGDHG